MVCFCCGHNIARQGCFFRVWMGDGYALICAECLRKLNPPAGFAEKQGVC